MKSIMPIVLLVAILLSGGQLTAQQTNPTAVAYFSIDENTEEGNSQNNLRFLVRMEDESLNELESKSSKYSKYFSLYINSYSSIADAECNVYFHTTNSNEKKMLYKLIKQTSIKQVRYKDSYYTTEEFFQKHVL